MAYDAQLLVRRIVRLLDQEPTLTLASLSLRLSVDRHTITRAVKTVTGQSFRALRQERLVAKVEQLMTDRPGASLKEVAVLIGYQHAGSLCRMVRSRTGQTTTLLRRRIAKQSSRGEP